MIKNISQVIETGSITYKKNPEIRKEIPESEFMTALSKNISSCMKYGNTKYIIDNDNLPIIKDLYYYLCCNENFSGDLDKGIILEGAIGSGKTILLSSFVKLIPTKNSGTKRFIHAKDVATNIDNTNNPYSQPFLSSIIYIDDIGKEPSEYKEYGNVIRPFEDFIRQRYERNILTFGTTNYTLKDLPYITHTKDRMIEMFNFIVLPGKTRRS